MFQQTIYRNTV